ncbi:MAG: hypothetical protein PUJ55_00845 [Clostridiales bacterium]|nr:hypothetical protein [Roseburia sp.]MDD7635466.1 hypothetical protein [Clostridiales bacterium]MDY4113923.1 hypothetical protein [Roseburia sp.]
MKKKLIFLSLVIFTGYILIFPKDAVSAASCGLVLWYEQVLPTLLPFAIVSNILISSGYLEYLIKPFSPLIRFLLPVSDNGAFVALSGFLFGFPMGSKNCAELLKRGQIEKKEADILFIITNNISPVFISSFILNQQLKMPSRTVASYLILYLPPLLIGKLILHKNRKESSLDTLNPIHAVAKRPASRSQMNFKIIDAGIMNGFETLTRLGGYIMLFSMIASILQKLPFSANLKLIFTGITEITNGIYLIPKTITHADSQYILAMAFTAFGGLSGIAQTSSMIKDTTLSLRTYCQMKVWLMISSGILAWLVTLCFPISS